MTGFEDEQVAVAITPEKSQAATLTDKARKGAKSCMSTASKETEQPLTRSPGSEKPPAQQTGMAGAPRNHDSDPKSVWMDDDEIRFQKVRENNFVKRCWAVISWTPPICRWNVENPPKFSLGLNLLFSFAAAFSVANLYYNHPILNILAADFHVTNEKASIIPTVMQAGYATGLILLCPLGDIFRRRAFVLTLTCITATMWLGLCLTTSFPAFAALSFITSVTTVTPQLILPLVGDIAPPAARAHALSLVVSGNLGGMLIARLLSGIVTEYTSWRVVYWIALAIQYLIVILLWAFMPDYPVKNDGFGQNYLAMLADMALMLTEYPVLVQACLVGFLISSTFTSYWTTLTFLLASPPYGYNSLVIGLFALIGLAAMTLGPPYSKAIMSRFVPLFSTLLGEVMCLVGVVIGTYTGTFTVAGPIIQAFAIDIGLQTSQIANRAAIYALVPNARNRLNTVYMVFVFSGQLTGTAVGNRLFAQGGWVRSGSASVGFIGAAILVCLARGPFHEGWIGWSGVGDWRKEGVREEKEQKDVEKTGDGGGRGRGGESGSKKQDRLASTWKIGTARS